MHAFLSPVFCPFPTFTPLSKVHKLHACQSSYGRIVALNASPTFESLIDSTCMCHQKLMCWCWTRAHLITRRSLSPSLSTSPSSRSSRRAACHHELDWRSKVPPFPDPFVPYRYLHHLAHFRHASHDHRTKVQTTQDQLRQRQYFDRHRRHVLNQISLSTTSHPSLQPRPDLPTGQRVQKQGRPVSSGSSCSGAMMGIPRAMLVSRNATNITGC